MMSSNIKITALNNRFNETQLNCFKESKQFQDWLREFNSNYDNKKYNLQQIELTDLDMFGMSVGFSKFTVYIKDKETGVFLPGITVLRGKSIGILVVVKCRDNIDIPNKIVLTKQFRAAASKEILEIPAGMLDGSNNPCGKAIDELKEETGIILKGSDLFNLTKFVGIQDGIYMSPGLLDEKIELFSTELLLTENEIKELETRNTGVLEQGEIIKLVTMNLHEAYNIPDAKLLSALLLYQQYLLEKERFYDITM